MIGYNVGLIIEINLEVTNVSEQIPSINLAHNLPDNKKI
jgi:hypothetical protein